MRQNPDVMFSKELGDKIDAILSVNNWDYTVRNMTKALLMLKQKGEVEKRISTPVERRELPIPTSEQPAAAAPVVVASAAAAAPASAATPASAAAVPAVPASKPASSAVAPATEGRLRPGSASTGLSPRQASVRPGARPEPAVGLTVEEYNRMSASETRRRYRTDLGFKTAVDKLIAEGKL